MVDEVGIDPLEPARVPLLQEIGVLSVESLSLPPRERAVEHVANDAAREGQPVAARVHRLLQDSVAHEAIHGVLQILRLVRQGREVAVLEALAEDRSDREDVAHLVREPLDPRLHGLLDRLGQRAGREDTPSGEIERARVVPGDRARVEERPDELLREERISLGGLEETRGERVGDLAPSGRHLHQRAVVRRRERAEGQGDEARVAAEGLQHLHERMALLDLGLAVRPDDERGRGREAPHDVLERLDGLLGAVQLLEDEDERLPLRDAGQRARDQLEDRDLVLGLRGAYGTGVGRGGPELADLAEHGEEREQVAGEVGEVGARRGARAGVLAAEVVLDQLAEALVSEGAVLLHEAALEHADLPGAREARELLDEPAFPDPRLARHDGELAFAGDGRVKPSLQLGDLLLAPDERRRRRLRPGHHPAGRQHHRARVLVLVELCAVSASAPRPGARPASSLFSGSFSRHWKTIDSSSSLTSAPRVRIDCGSSWTMR